VRVKPATRIVGAVLVPILAATTVVLWGWPGETERLFFGWRSTSAGRRRRSTVGGPRSASLA
jgi:hypothetical protein